jgi:hypothetical protein
MEPGAKGMEEENGRNHSRFRFVQSAFVRNDSKLVFCIHLIAAFTGTALMTFLILITKS